PMNPMSHAPALRHVNISGMVGCPTGKISAPIRAPRARAMSRRMIPTEAPFGSPASIVYMTECTPTRILPAFARSATRASETCCASATLANMAAKVTERRGIFICASKARGGPRRRTRGHWSSFAFAYRALRNVGRLVVSLRLDASELDHLAPLLGFVDDQFTELGRRSRQRRAAEVGEAHPHLVVGERRVDLLVELVH